jgi:hypothetical protein
LHQKRHVGKQEHEEQNDDDYKIDAEKLQKIDQRNLSTEHQWFVLTPLNKGSISTHEDDASCSIHVHLSDTRGKEWTLRAIPVRFYSGLGMPNNTAKGKLQENMPHCRGGQLKWRKMMYYQ